MERELEFHPASGDPVRVRIRIGRPVREDQGGWSCPYSIQSVSFSKMFRMVGEDSMQALILALKTIQVELEVLAKNNNGSFTWLGASDLGLL